ncbi:MAG: ThuA domain-containing protein [Gaiellaceae bacterium]
MRTGFAVLALAFAAAPAIGVSLAAETAARDRPRILVFTKTAGFRHTSIPVAVRAIRELGQRHGLTVDATEDAGAFTQSNLRQYRAVVFLLTTGDVLNEAQQAAFERFVRGGGGFAGVHSAADTEDGWEWYGRLLGTRFRSHPQIQRAAVRVSNRKHPSTSGLPANWLRVDEWYNFTRNPRPAVEVLARLDEASYAPGDGAMGADHPIAWAHSFQGGRSWFTGGGHTDESYAEPLFRRHLLGGIRYAAGLTPPRILSVTHTVRARKVVVRVRYGSCRPCAGRLEVLVRGRRFSSRLQLGGGVGIGRSALQPRGPAQFWVVLTDPLSGVGSSVRRSFRTA